MDDNCGAVSDLGMVAASRLLDRCRPLRLAGAGEAQNEKVGAIASGPEISLHSGIPVNSRVDLRDDSLIT